MLAAILTDRPAYGVMTTNDAVRSIPLNRRIVLPARAVVGQAELTDGSATNALAVWGGAADEPPEGPNGFGVLGDGSIVISDPLEKRIVVFDAQGQFRKAVPLGFAVDSVRIDEEDTVVVREATTGTLHTLAPMGDAHAAKAGIGAAEGSARMLPDNRGEILLPAAPEVAESKLKVSLDIAGATLISIELLKLDAERNVFIAVEFTGDVSTEQGISLHKNVRKYSGAGRFVCEVVDLSLDYFVMPVDELRVSRGNIYQLMTARSSVTINVWSTA